MWLIEQISRKPKGNCIRPAILNRLLCKYYPQILVLETCIYIKHDSERCQPQLMPASVSAERGWKRNFLACVSLYDSPPWSNSSRALGKEIYYTFASADPFSGGVISNCPSSPLPVSPLPLASTKTIWSFCFSINVSVSICQCWVDSGVLRGISK